MYHLIKKDFLIQKGSLKLTLLFMLILTIALNQLGAVGLMIGILAVTYQLVLGASAIEDQKNSEMMLVSLPIKRSTIVISKYFSVYVFTMFAMIGFYLIYLAVNLLPVPMEINFSIDALIGAVIAVTLWCSISFPLIFKFGYLKSKIANLIIFFIFVFGGTWLISFLSNGQMDGEGIPAIFAQQTDMTMLILIIVFAIFLLVASFGISLAFYKKREF